MPGSAWFWCELFLLVGPPRYYNLGRLCCSRSYACRGSQIARCLLVYYAQGLLLKSRAADLASGQASRASKGYYACTVPILLFFFCKQRLIRALACGHNERALQAQRAIKNTYSVCGNSPSVDAFAEEEDRSSIKTSRMIQPRQTEGAPTFHRRTLLKNRLRASSFFFSIPCSTCQGHTSKSGDPMPKNRPKPCLDAKIFVRKIL
jgi:hypothetical protein